jgi:hypothetical protein
MSVYYADDLVTLHLGDCLDALPTIADASVDAVVCDPPYEINMMGRTWDNTGIAYNVDVWRECWRVLKPGGHLAAFGATRTYHRMTCAIEDAGFEIRDSLHWIYGSGFPKGQDIAKSIDRRRDDRPAILKVTAWLAAARDSSGWTNRQVDALWGFNGMAGLWTTQGKAAMAPTWEQWQRLQQELGFGADMDAEVQRLEERKHTMGEAFAQREEIGRRHSGLSEGSTSVFLSGTTGRAEDGTVAVTAPASAAAQQWQGWNTSLKPAHEPIVLARKSTGYETTVANVLLHGTGAINVDACRTRAGEDYREKCASVVGIGSPRNGDTLGEWTGVREDSAHTAGRWPANVLLAHQPLIDEHGEVVGDACVDSCVPGCPVAEMDRQTAGKRASKPSKTGRAGASGGSIYGGGKGLLRGAEVTSRDDEGGASRFFPVFRYEAKAPASERPRLARKPVMRLRADLTEEQRAYVLAELMKAGADVA